MSLVYRAGDKERQFADLIWESAPISSHDLVTRAAERLGWAKSTTYTVLKRLTQKGLFENRGGTVHVCMSREQFEAGQSREFVDTFFHGSLPGFINAFTDGRPLSESEIESLERLIKRARKDE